jgi:hypothetical protein
MNAELLDQCTAFDGHTKIGSGPIHEVALLVKRATERAAAGLLLVYNDATGKPVDLDLRGTDDDIVRRLPAATVVVHDAESGPDSGRGRGRGRPRLGVVAREVTLLPRHWDWLATQPGGASVALRRLVEEARRANVAKDARRMQQAAAYAFMSAMAGDFPGFEEATRALFAGDQARFDALVSTWPTDVRDHATKLAFGDRDQIASASDADPAQT